MNSGRTMRLLCAGILVTIAIAARPQQPFDLDPSFRTEIDTWYVSSIAPLSNGDLLISGQIKFPGDLVFRPLAKLDAQGGQVPGFPYSYGSGKLTPWNDQFYVASAQTVRRLLPSGLVDDSFIHMNSGLYFSSGQGGDYHVFPDGRVLMSGVHQLNDVARGYVGYYCLCWFSSEGYLDTTRIHRTCSGSLDYFQALPDGKFIGSGATSTYDGQPASNIFRFNADGSLDPTFQANVTWGSAFGFLPLDDGRVYAAGQFLVSGEPDTLRLVRFLPDGSLDPTFNNHLHFQSIELDGSTVVSDVFPIDDGRLVLTGGFELVEGEARQSICLIDTAGNLLNEHFWGPGCGDYSYQGYVYGSLEGIMPSTDGSFYIWGAYHGYDDGTTNDTTQRMVSRLYGSDVGVREQARTGGVLHVYPNPASSWVAFDYDLQGLAQNAELQVMDVTGRVVWSTALSTAKHQVLWDVRTAKPGSYTVRLSNAGKQLATQQLLLQP